MKKPTWQYLRQSWIGAAIGTVVLYLLIGDPLLSWVYLLATACGQLGIWNDWRKAEEERRRLLDADRLP